MNIKVFITLIAFLVSMNAGELKVEDRGSWSLNSIGQNLADEPSNLKYFQYYDVLPDDINLKIFENKDLSNIGDKKLFVGYGIADPSGKNCMLFPPSATGLTEPISICMPWWRIEREYKNEQDSSASILSALDRLRKPKAPILVNVCEGTQDTKYYSGGKISCTSYYDRLTDEDCWNNPNQAKCFVDNCSNNIVNNCTYEDTIVGEDTTLETATLQTNDAAPQHTETKVNLASHIYNCPGGSLSNTCTSQKTVMMFPYECKVDDANTEIDDGEYVYCDESKPVYETSGRISGFRGNCSDGRNVICKADSFQNTTAECVSPIYENFSKFANYDFEAKKDYKEYSIDVLSGETDIYSTDDNCIRANTIDDSRDKELYVKIVGSGSLDDDIYVIAHNEGGDFNRIYCNMQHAGASPDMTLNMKSCMQSRGFSTTITSSLLNDAVACGTGASIFSVNDVKVCMMARGYQFGTGAGKLKSGDEDIIFTCGQSSSGGNATKNYNGVPLSCIRNNGSYSFNQTVRIFSSDIVTVQQNSENEAANGTPFALGRNHYTSSKLTMDGVEVAPSAYAYQFPYYPTNSSYLRTWDNTTSTFSILFPFASSYQIFFYNDRGEEVAQTFLDVNDFKSMGNGNLNLKLGGSMALASNIPEKSANRSDPWVEWGGGVYGGRDSLTGAKVSSPNDAYVKSNAVTNIIVKDLIKGTITPIAMVYPLPYPNRIFASKLKVYEHRKYRCYNNFPSFTPPSSGTTNKIVCTSDQAWINYDNGLSQSMEGIQTWPDTKTCEQNCFTQNSCVASKMGDLSGYTCAQRGGENLGGDLAGNLFSKASDCNVKCVKNDACTTYAESDCEVVNESLDNQVQDYTGKTIFTRKNTTYRCKENETRQVGCASYNYTTVQGNINVNFESIGYETKDFSDSFEDSLAKVNMIDVGSQHIWSGWAGKCVIGMKMDSSYLSNPMTIMSYAMSAYSSYNQLAGNANTSLLQQAKTQEYSQTLKDAATSIDNAITSVENGINQASDYVTNGIGKVFSSGAEGAGNAGANVGGAVGDAATNQPPTFTSQVGEIWNHKLIDSDSKWLKEITVGDLVKFGVSTAMDILSPTEEEFSLATKLINPFANEDDVGVQAYNSCLTSIGLSYPAMVAYSFDESDAMSNELKKPYEHPLRLTTEELQTLVSTMGLKYVNATYRYSSDDNIVLNVIASNSDAYIKAGEVICAGHKVSMAMTYINLKTQKPLPSIGGNSAAGIASSVAINAIAMVNPALGFAMRIALDLYTNMFTKIDSCHDEADAIGRSLHEYKTMKFNTNGLCKETRTYCDKYMNFGFTKKCVRDGYDFCCYDKATTKIFAEALKEQLDQNWDNCQGITVNDLKDISFRECRAGEIPSVNKCIATDKFDEYKSTLFKQAARGINVGGLTEQVIEAIKQE